MDANTAVFLEPWEALEERFELIARLRDVPQDPVFHAEGDVHIHTRQVCEALEALPEWRALDDRARAIVRAGAIFHDIGKPAKTEISDEGRVSSRNHALLGARMFRELFYREFPLPFADREAVAALVLLHSLPHRFLDKPDPRRSVIRASMVVNCQWLSIVARADALGRVCKTPDGWDDVQLFREFCAENGCLETPRVFPSDHSRYLFFNEEKECLDFAIHDDTRFEVVMLAGLPAAGKDTLRAQRFGDLPAISLDELREQMDVDPEDDQGHVAAAAKDAARELMRKRQSFLWNATNVTRPRRKQLVSLFSQYGGRTRIVYVESPYERVIERNRARSRPVPLKVIDSLIARLDVPAPDEAHAVEFVLSS